MTLYKHAALVALIAFLTVCPASYVLVDRSQCKDEHGVVAKCLKVE